MPKQEAVLSRLENAGLRLTEGKCVFMLSSAEYLGQRISEEGTYPASENIRAITEAPVPSDIQQLWSFLGLMNYYSKFLHNFSTNWLLSMACYKKAGVGLGDRLNKKHSAMQRQH
jgi:hypothetical protein